MNSTSGTDHGGSAATDRRCPSLNPKSTRPDDRCQRPVGHEGYHVGNAHSGSIVIYPSKWQDGDE